MRGIGVQRTLRTVAALAAVCLSVACADEPPPRVAIDQQAVARANSFLSDVERGQFVLQFVHLGTTYHGHPVVGMRDRETVRELAAGEFELLYDFAWDGDGHTVMGFACDRAGRIRDVRIVDTNAVLAQPFLVANATIGALGAMGVEAMEDEITERDMETMRELVDAADAKRLLVLFLTLQQASS